MNPNNFKTKIFDVTKQNKNGYSYSKECIQKMVGTFPIMACMPDERTDYSSYALDKIIGKCTSIYNEAEDVLEIEGTFIKDFPEDYYLVPCGIGNVNEDNTVSDYYFYAFSICNSSSFKESKISIVY